MDESLRALERAARANGADRAAGWAYVRGLDRAGDAVGAWRERCRLARAGDLAAWDELTWCPRGVRLEPRVTARVEVPSGGLVSGGGPQVVLLDHTTDGLTALDARTFDARWSCAGAVRSVRLGPCVASVDGSTAALLSCADGHVLATVPIPQANDLEDLEIRAAADRVEVGGLNSGTGEEESIVVAVGPDVRVVPRPPAVGSVVLALAGEHAIWSAPSRPEAAGDAPEMFVVSLSDPARRRPLPGSRVLFADARSVVVGWGRASPSTGRRLECALVDVVTGGLTWAWSRGDQGYVHAVVAHAEEVFIASSQGVEYPALQNPAIESRDRSTGTVLWRTELDGRLVSFTRVVAGADVVHVLGHSGRRDGWGPSTIAAFDRVSGSLLWSRSGSLWGFELLDGAVVAASLLGDRGPVVLERLEA